MVTIRPEKWSRLMISRRLLLQAIAAGTAVVVVHPKRIAAGLIDDSATPLASAGSFLTTEEVAILDAATARILPSDDLPGAREIGVIDYIQNLLTFLPGSDANCDRRVSAADIVALEGKVTGHSNGCPRGGDVNGDDQVDAKDVPSAAAAIFRARPMFGGGPFSGRNPQPGHRPIGDLPCQLCHGPDDGAASFTMRGASTATVVPPNAFRDFLPLTRLQALSWKVRILGAEGVPELESNPLVRDLLEVDLRRRYRNGLALLEDASQRDFGTSFTGLSNEQQTQVMNQPEVSRFVELLTHHVVQGTLCAPEYGGNRDALGWQLVGFDGDSQPLGYEIYDSSLPDRYREREDKPNSSPNPGEPCSEFSEVMKELLLTLSGFTGGGLLAGPYCFGVDR